MTRVAATVEVVAEVVVVVLILHPRKMVVQERRVKVMTEVEQRLILQMVVVIMQVEVEVVRVEVVTMR